MFVVDTVLNLVFNLTIIIGKLIITAIVAISSLLAYFFQKSIFYGICMFLSLTTNVLWIFRNKGRSYLLVPMAHLTVLNIFVIAGCIEVEWIWSIKVVFSGGDKMCKLIKWFQTLSVMESSAVFIYLLIVFRQPQCFETKMKEDMLLVWLISPLLAIPQVRFK